MVRPKLNYSYMETIRVSVYSNDTVTRPKLDNRDSISVSVFFPPFLQRIDRL